MRMIVPRKEIRSKKAYWVVSLGKRYTGSNRQRRYCQSRKEAREFIENSEQARIKFGQEAFVLSPELRMEAIVCWKKLKPLKLALSVAVDFYIENAPEPGTYHCIQDLTSEFLKSRKQMNCRPRTMAQYESYLRVLNEEFGPTELISLKRPKIEDWLEESEWSPRTKKNYLVTLTTLFNFAINKGYCQENPVAKINRPILEDRPVEILTVRQVKNLLSKASEYDPRLFAGLRRSEFFELEWSEVDLDERTIEVKAAKPKTRQRRVIHMQDNLREWLMNHRKTKGPICPEKHIDGFSERLRKLAGKAGIDPWPHNAIRHSFGSYFLAKTKDENLTAKEMGNSPQIMHKHYENWRS